MKTEEQIRDMILKYQKCELNALRLKKYDDALIYHFCAKVLEWVLK